MKKTLSALLVGSMLVFPVPALASEDTDTINSLSFETLEEVMKENNPTIEFAREDFSDGADKLDTSKITPVKDDILLKIGTLEKALTGSGYISFDQASKTFLTTQDPTDATKTLLTPIPFATLIVQGSDPVAIAVIPQTVNPSALGHEPDMPASTSEYLSYMNYNLLKLYIYQLGSINVQIATIEGQADNLWKQSLQIDKAEDQLIWGAQTLYLSYYNLYDQKDNLNNNLNLLQKQLSVLKLQESLGMVTATQVAEVESQIKDLQMGLDQLNKGLEGIKGQLNVFLGQDYDTPLQLKEPVSLAQSKIRAMDYEGDLEDALVQSYDVRLEDNSNKRGDAERSFTLAFHNAYQDVQDKLKTLDLESYKLTNEKTKYDQAVLKNSLGLMSNLEFEGARSKYTTQVNKVDTAEEDLLKAYTAYDWMKQGLTISTTASGSSQSTGAAGASGATGSSGASGAPAGMGF